MRACVLNGLFGGPLFGGAVEAIAFRLCQDISAALHFRNSSFNSYHTFLVTQKSAFGSVVHCRVEGDCSVATHLVRTALFGVEVVLAWSARDDLAVLGHAETLCVRLIGFHVSSGFLSSLARKCEGTPSHFSHFARQ